MPVRASGKARRLKVTVPTAQEISGAWQVAFDPNWGGPAKATFDGLEDRSKRPEKGIKYYSGTANYRKTFRFKPSVKAERYYLDLGEVAVMASVKLNGNSLGILWKPPYRIDVTEALRKGDSLLELSVVNLWCNRQIGDEQLPEDSERNANGTLKLWPQWLGKPSPMGRFTFSSWRLWKKNDPLVESGLLGPVKIFATRKVGLEP